MATGGETSTNLSSKTGRFIHFMKIYRNGGGISSVQNCSPTVEPDCGTNGNSSHKIWLTYTLALFTGWHNGFFDTLFDQESNWFEMV